MFDKITSRLGTPKNKSELIHALEEQNTLVKNEKATNEQEIAKNTKNIEDAQKIKVQPSVPPVQSKYTKPADLTPEQMVQQAKDEGSHDAQ